MNNPAFLVDGQTEQRMLQKICPGHPIRLINCNGKAVEIPAIAKKVEALIAALNNKFYPIVILIDREDRTDSADSIEKKLNDELVKLGVHQEIIIGVADRMIENWILADFDSLIANRKLKADIKDQNFEECSGKSVIRKFIPDYHETTDGVELLAKANPKKIFKNSISFNRFARKIQLLKCKWLSGIIS